jgi:hypothetical protein
LSECQIGIQKSGNYSVQLTVDENIKKSSRAMHSLMGAGLHGENGIDPATSISLLRPYILAILYYGVYKWWGQQHLYIRIAYASAFSYILY